MPKLDAVLLSLVVLATAVGALWLLNAAVAGVVGGIARALSVFP